MLNRIVLLAMLLSFHSFAGEPVILLTGFEPFGGAKVNASWEAVRVYQGKTIAGHRVETLELPVVYDAVEAPLKAAIVKFKPAAVICFGEGSGLIQIEKIARNGYHASKPRDNKGQPPPREKIDPNGPDTIRTGLPIDAIRDSIASVQIHPDTSEDAGGYLCNECFYRLMAMPHAPLIRGFIHLPVPYSFERYTPSDLKRAVAVAASVSLGKPPVRILAFSDGFLDVPRDNQLTSLFAEKLQDDGFAVQDPNAYKLQEIRELKRIDSFLSPQKFDYVFFQQGAIDHMKESHREIFRFATVSLLRASSSRGRSLFFPSPISPRPPGARRTVTIPKSPNVSCAISTRSWPSKLKKLAHCSSISQPTP